MFVRTMTALVLLCVVSNVADAQYLNLKPVGNATVQRSSEVPEMLSATKTLRFREFTMIYDGGSRIARFELDNQEEFTLVFPHTGFWTDAAIAEAKQPVGYHVDTPSGRKIIEIEPKSAFEKRLLELLTDDLLGDVGTRKDRRTIRRIRDRVKDRKVIRELKADVQRATSED